MGGTRGSYIVSRADDVLKMSVVHGTRGVVGVCEMCMAQGGVGGECIGLYQSGRNRYWDVCLNFNGVGGVIT